MWKTSVFVIVKAAHGGGEAGLWTVFEGPDEAEDVTISFCLDECYGVVTGRSGCAGFWQVKGHVAECCCMTIAGIGAVDGPAVCGTVSRTAGSGRDGYPVVT